VLSWPIFEGFIEVGRALLEIRDSRLYLGTHSTFEDYCRERWNLSERRSYQLMDAAKNIQNLNQGTTLPDSERVVRPLTSLEPDQQREVWQKAVETVPEGKTTALFRLAPLVFSDNGQARHHFSQLY
jgi:hypothetical protein